MDICSWCSNALEQSDNLIMCDECPRVFCDDCVIRAHGNGIAGESIVNKLLEDDGTWACIYCIPTKMLDAMRAFLKLDSENGSVSSQIIDEGADKITTSQDKDEKLAELFEELSALEEELNETSSMLEYDGLKKKLLELKQKRPQHLEADIESELNRWTQETRDRHHRCSDAIGIIQDDLGKYNAYISPFFQYASCLLTSLHSIVTDYAGINLMAFYKDREQNNGTMLEETVDVRKIAADEELDKRDMNLGLAKGADRGASGWSGRETNYREVDELTSSELNEIEDINTTEKALKQLEQIVQRKLNGMSGQGGSVFDAKTISNFKKNISRDDRELKELKVRVKRKSEQGDKRRETLQLKSDCRIISTKNAAAMRVVSRSSKRLVEKRVGNKHKKATIDFIKRRTNPSNRILDQQVDQECGSGDTVFVNSTCVLASPTPTHPSAHSQNDDVAVAAPLAKLLKPHQIDGVKFMWETAFGDLRSSLSPGSIMNGMTVRGCILGKSSLHFCEFVVVKKKLPFTYILLINHHVAHNMGLGKSLQVVTLIHTLLTHPRLLNRSTCVNVRARIIDKILLIVPVNTLQNWKAEFTKWLIHIPKIIVYDFSSTKINARTELTKRWEKSGGVMLVTQDTFSRIDFRKDEATSIYFKQMFLSPGPEAVFIDEGHLMLKSKNTKISKVLFSMETPRRVVLTGTPLQNNLHEFYYMTNWIKPGCLGTEAQFEKKFVSKIMPSLMVSTSLLICEYILIASLIYQHFWNLYMGFSLMPSSKSKNSVPSY
jgi:SNF2 family DNA or RNA helicase